MNGPLVNFAAKTLRRCQAFVSSKTEFPATVIMNTKTDYTSYYLRFISLVQDINNDSAYPALDPIEERILHSLASRWHKSNKVSVKECVGMLINIPPATASRRLKVLLNKGMIALKTDKDDGRIRYIVPTPLASRYFESLGQAMVSARS